MPFPWVSCLSCARFVRKVCLMWCGKKGRLKREAASCVCLHHHQEDAEWEVQCKRDRSLNYVCCCRLLHENALWFLKKRLPWYCLFYCLLVSCSVVASIASSHTSWLYHIPLQLPFLRVVSSWDSEEDEEAQWLWCNRETVTHRETRMFPPQVSCRTKSAKTCGLRLEVLEWVSKSSCLVLLMNESKPTFWEEGGIEEPTWTDWELRNGLSKRVDLFAPMILGNDSHSTGEASDTFDEKEEDWQRKQRLNKYVTCHVCDSCCCNSGQSCVVSIPLLPPTFQEIRFGSKKRFARERVSWLVEGSEVPASVSRKKKSRIPCRTSFHETSFS